MAQPCPSGSTGVFKISGSACAGNCFLDNVSVNGSVGRNPCRAPRGFGSHQQHRFQPVPSAHLLDFVAHSESFDPFVWFAFCTDSLIRTTLGPPHSYCLSVLSPVLVYILRPPVAIHTGCCFRWSSKTSFLISGRSLPFQFFLNTSRISAWSQKSGASKNPEQTFSRSKLP